MKHSHFGCTAQAINRNLIKNQRREPRIDRVARAGGRHIITNCTIVLKSERGENRHSYKKK